MHRLPEDKKLAKGVKLEKQRIEYEQLQLRRMSVKNPMFRMSKKERMAGWSHSLDQIVTFSLIFSIPAAVLNIEINVFNYIFEWLGFNTINFYDYSN